MSTVNPLSRKSAKNSRLESVTDYCNQPRTIKEIERRFGIAYGTAWAYVKELVTTGKLIQLDQLKDGSIAYASNKAPISAMPSFFNPHHRTHTYLNQFAYSADPAVESRTEAIGKLLPLKITELAYAIANEDLGSAIKVQDELAQLHNELLGVTTMVRQIIEHPRMYNINEMHKIALAFSDEDKLAISSSREAYTNYYASIDEGE